MNNLIPTIGRIVHYRLSVEDAEQINRRRMSGAGSDVAKWPLSAQAHVGNVVLSGYAFPMIITKVWGDTPESAVNGQVFLDGNDVLWVTSVHVGQETGTFSWPVRV